MALETINPFIINKIETICLVCNKPIDLEDSVSVQNVVPIIEKTVFEALKLLSNFGEFNIEPESLRVCLTCFQLTSTSVFFKKQCDKSMVSLKAYLEYQENCTNIKEELLEEETIKVEDTYDESMVVLVESDINCNGTNDNFQVSLDNDLSSFQSTTFVELGTTENFTCVICNRIFKNIRTYRNHTRQNNCNPNKLQCQYCELEFEQKAAWVLHVQTHKSEDLNDYKNNEKCGNHTKLNEENVAGLMKNKSNNNKTAFNQDSQSVHDEYMPSSPNDDSDSSQSCKKISKKATNTENNKWCIICKKNLKTVSIYKVHMKLIHGNPGKRFICVHCKKAFSRKGDLGIHLRIHTGEKPYICDLCGKAFCTSSPLKIHQMRKHR